MHKSIMALATAALIAGAVFSVACKDDPETMLPDMAKSDGPPTVPPDMVVAKVGCAGLVTCYNDCEETATTQAEFETCQANCDKKAKSGSTTKYQNALACGQGYCLGNVDAGDGKCRLSADMTRLTNADGSMIASTDPGTAPKECGACLNNALAGLFNSTCTPSNSPDCNPASCTTVTNTCLNEQ